MATRYDLVVDMVAELSKYVGADPNMVDTNTYLDRATCTLDILKGINLKQKGRGHSTHPAKMVKAVKEWEELNSQLLTRMAEFKKFLSDNNETLAVLSAMLSTTAKLSARMKSIETSLARLSNFETAEDEKS